MSEPAPQGQPLHDDVIALGFLLGTWAGEGQGKFATIKPFYYREEVSFGHTGKAFLTYSQRSWSTSDGRPLHAETGYWRAGAEGTVELVLAHPTGIAEVEEGTIDGGRLELSSRSIGLSSSAKPVTAISRSLWVDGDILRYKLAMAAFDQPVQQHLNAELHRIS
jgi:hypothetical protein